MDRDPRREPESRRAGIAAAATAFARGESGLTAIEYALLASLIAMGIVLGAAGIGSNTAGLFNAVADTVASPSAAAAAGGGLGGGNGNGGGQGNGKGNGSGNGNAGGKGNGGPGTGIGGGGGGGNN